MEAKNYLVKLDDLSGREIAELLTLHLRSLSELSPPESMHALDLGKLRSPNISFWSVWENGNLAGCGALKQLDDEHGEIKSMRTVSSYLRKGVASCVLKHIISVAKKRKYKRLSLETGAGEPFDAAFQLYRKFGFKECAPFGDYKPDPNSRFMTMDLATIAWIEP